MKYSVRKADVVVVGGGLAGLRAAYEAVCSDCSVTVLSKGPRCSAEVSGFNAPVGKDDSTELYIKDILHSACGIGNRSLAKILAEHSLEEVRFLENLGLCLQKDANEDYALLQPLQCSVPRLVHMGTATGAEAERLLLQALQEKGVEVQTPVTALELLTDCGKICGVLGYENRMRQLVVYEAKSVVLAAGGCGGLFEISTYAKEICGDAVSLAYRAGAKLVDMEFQDFEPCCLTAPEKLRGRGISSTMLFAGGEIRNTLGESVIDKYFSDRSKISKNRLAKALYQEIQNGTATQSGGVYYDLRQIPETVLTEHETYLPLLRKNDLNPRTTMLEVAPAAHTCLGGVQVNADCASSVPGLFAAGEAMGGLHGASRIGGNAGTEVFVFGAIAGGSAANYAKSYVKTSEAERVARRLLSKKRPIIKTNADEIRKAVSEGLSIVRNAEKILLLKDKLRQWNSTELSEPITPFELADSISLTSMLQTAEIIAVASLMREESRGVFNRSDFTKLRPEFDDKHTVIYQEGNKICAKMEQLEGLI